MSKSPVIAVLGASGLIGEAVCRHLIDNGYSVRPIARRFTASAKAALGGQAVESPIVSLDVAALGALLADADIVVNCIGVLQDGPRGRTADIHSGFVARLLAVLAERATPALLVHLSIPGADAGDATPFSRSKRAAEHAIAASAVPHAILRPGMVIAPAAYGGSALLRALAVLPLALPAALGERPFAVTDAADIGRTVGWLAARWQSGERDRRAVWDVMAREPTTVRDVLGAFGGWLGGPARRIALPSWLMALGAWLGDAVAQLGWAPPIRSTALAEMRRGVEGDPAPWIAATGIAPAPLALALQRLPATVQENWFARLYLLKALVLVILVLFWDVSALIAFRSFDAAASILTTHGFPLWQAQAVTFVTTLADLSIGLLIAWRPSSRFGLLAGIAMSLFYMVSAALITPELWLEPLGALVKTGPAIVLMLVALAMRDDR